MSGVVVALATFALTFPLNAMVGRDFIPPDDQSEFQVSLNWPEGTSVEGTAKLATEISDRIAQIPELRGTAQADLDEIFGEVIFAFFTLQAAYEGSGPSCV